MLSILNTNDKKVKTTTTKTIKKNNKIPCQSQELNLGPVTLNVEELPYQPRAIKMFQHNGSKCQ